MVGGSVIPSKSPNVFEALVSERRVSAGIGVTFVFRDMVRLELNYVWPLRSHTSDSCNFGFQFGAGINFL